MPRQILFPSDSGEMRAQLHLFSDASEVGYGAAAYVRCEINEDRWVCNLLVAKSRMAPIKKVTVPRLELTATLLASRLYRMIESQINVKFEKVMFWTDSVLVLWYIRNTSARFIHLCGEPCARAAGMFKGRTVEDTSVLGRIQPIWLQEDHC